MLFTLERIGAWLRVAEEPWVSDSLLRQAKEILGEDVVSTSIAERAQTSANVAAYVDAENSLRAAWAKKESTKREPARSYEQFRTQVASAGLQGWPDWEVNSGPSELRLAALDLVRQTEPRKQMQYLQIFWRNPFPLDYEYLIGLANSTDSGVAAHALEALSRIRDDKIRQFALALVENRSPYRDHAVQLIVENFRPGDREMVKEWCEKESDPATLSGYHMNLGDFLDAHPNVELEIAMLTTLYDRQPCSDCRCGDVKRLIELNALPEELRAESAYDSYLDTRELVAG